MKNFELIRQNYRKPDMDAIDVMRDALEELIYDESEMTAEEKIQLISKITDFQDRDGSFNLLNSFQIESDCRVYYCYEPTYICSAILIKMLLDAPELMPENICLILEKALHVCCNRGLNGHGYDSLKGKNNALKYFIQADVKTFLSKYPSISYEFADMFRKLEKEYVSRVENQAFYGDWNKNYEDDIRYIEDYFQSSRIFVYGTLMKGEANHHHLLNDAEFLGEGTIDGYEMYDLGNYPGIKAGTGTVTGEVYKVSPAELAAIDRLEGEGYLYIKTPVNVKMSDSKVLETYAYVYNHGVTGCMKLNGRYTRLDE